MAPQLRQIFGAGRSPGPREQMETERRQREAASIMEERRKRMEGMDLSGQVRVPGYILVDGEWVIDESYEPTAPKLEDVIAQAAPRQATPSISNLVPPTGEMPTDLRKIDIPFDLLGGPSRTPGSGFPAQGTPTGQATTAPVVAQELIPGPDRQGAIPDWLTKIREQLRSDYTTRRQELADIAPDIARIEQQRQEVMQPAERPTGAGALIEALFSLGSTGNVFDVRDARERKRQKAFNLLNMQRQELIDRQAGLRTQQESAADRFFGQYEREREQQRKERATRSQIKNSEDRLAFDMKAQENTQEYREWEKAHQEKAQNFLQMMQSQQFTHSQKVAAANDFYNHARLQFDKDKELFKREAEQAESEAIREGQEKATDALMMHTERTQELIADMLWEGRLFGEMGGAVGMRIFDPTRWGPWWDEQPLPGTESGNYAEKLKELKGKLSVDAIQKLAGSAPNQRRTNLLLEQVINSVGALSRNQTKKAHINSLKKLRRQLYESMSKLAPERMENYDLIPLVGDTASWWTKYHFFKDKTMEEALQSVFGAPQRFQGFQSPLQWTEEPIGGPN